MATGPLYSLKCPIVGIAVLFVLSIASAQDLEANITAANIISRRICSINESTLKDFYTSVKSSNEGPNNRQHPDDQDGTLQQLWGVEQTKKEIIVFYPGFYYPDITGRDLQQDYFEWCIYLYSPANESLYGCRKGNEIHGSSDFLKLGILEQMHYSEYFNASIIIPRGPLINALQEALITVRVSLPWLNHTTTVFYSLVISESNTALITKFPSQESVFLVVGQQKILQYDVFVTRKSLRYFWAHNGVEVLKVNDVENTTCTQLGGVFNKCLNYSVAVAYSLRDIDAEQFSDCRLDDAFRTRRRSSLLSFNTPSVNDTGEYRFSVSTFNDPPVEELGRSVFIAVVFAEFPLEDPLHLTSGSPANLSCVLKAPSNATVYWAFNEQEVDSVDMADGHCNRIMIAKESVDNGLFSIFHADLEICNVTNANMGKYTCMVEYSDPSTEDIYTAHLDVDTLVLDDPGMSPPSLERLTVAYVVGGAVAGLVLIAVVVIVAVTILFVTQVSRRKRRFTLKRRPSIHPHLFKDEEYVDLCSPDIQKVGKIEFPVRNLKLQAELGRGKFGRVYKAKAYGIIPSSPNINTVAVKTIRTNGSFVEKHLLLNELELMKKLHKQPHKNICNLLGFCTKNDFSYIILEYACYGNLKQYLTCCSTAVLEQGLELFVDSSATLPARDMSCTRGDTFNNLQIVPSAVNPLSADTQLTGFPTDSEGLDKPQETETAEFSLVPGLLEERQICDFAYQIACGLQHLAHMNVVHCDLAARNILIAEKGILKIGDFGMARELSDDNDDLAYQNLPQPNDDKVIAAKWASLETLDKQPHTFKSDIWSFGVVIWEIASYGNEPFSEFKIGATFGPFLQYLKEGHRLIQPNGLSNFIYRRLLSCWAADPEMRPAAEELVEFFQNVDPNTMALEDMLEEVTV